MKIFMVRISQTLYIMLVYIAVNQSLFADTINVEISKVKLNMSVPAMAHVGQLIYRGGILLKSSNEDFGGFSALGISSDGIRLLALSDRGRQFSAQLIYNKTGKLIGITGATLDKIFAPGGAPLLNKSLADVESMSPGVNGEIIVSFERQHRIWRYMPNNPEPIPLPPPSGLEALPENRGIEALTLLYDGSLLAISEGNTEASETIGWVSNTNGWSPLTYKLNDKFLPTGAATFGNGDVIILERYFNLAEGNKIRIRQISRNTIIPGAELQGTLLAELIKPMIVDNFEGIEVRQTLDGRKYIYLISDDNFNPLQSTYLLMFELGKH